MDLNDYWQENKRFVTTTAVGVVAFLIGLLVLDSIYDDDITNARARIAKLESDLGKPMFQARDLRAAQEENDALQAAVARLGEDAAFQPREGFRLDPELGSPANQYLRALARVREEVLPRAGRANLTVDEGLGMPKLSPTRESDIVRYLEALDVIETTVRLAIDADVRRVDKVQIRLDPGLNAREGLGRIERTRVTFSLAGDSLSMSRLLSWTQRPRDGRALHVDEVELVPARNKDDEVRMELVIVIPRLSEPTEEA